MLFVSLLFSYPETIGHVLFQCESNYYNATRYNKSETYLLKDVIVDMSFENFKYICATCWKDKYVFLVIDKYCSFNDGWYRKGFKHFLWIQFSAGSER